MNEPSPLVPQGSFESQAKRKSHVRIAVFSILAIHVVVLGGLLILGCKKDDNKAQETAAAPMTNDAAPPPFGNDAVGTASNVVAQAASNALGSIPIPPSITATTTPPVNPLPPEAGLATTHVIVAGDNFSTLATKYGVSAKAIQAANPDLVPTALKLGAKVRIPPKVAAAAPAGGTTIGAVPTADTHVVKANDTLGQIAKENHTTVKELQKLNNLPTTQIKVGQKLKLPPKPAAPPAGGGTPLPL